MTRRLPQTPGPSRRTQRQRLQLSVRAIQDAAPQHTETVLEPPKTKLALPTRVTLPDNPMSGQIVMIGAQRLTFAGIRNERVGTVRKRRLHLWAAYDKKHGHALGMIQAEPGATLTESAAIALIANCQPQTFDTAQLYPQDGPQCVPVTSRRVASKWG